MGAAEQKTSFPPVHGVLETALYVHDLAAAQNFYERVLGLNKRLAQEGRHVFFSCGQGMLLLFHAESSLQELAGPAPGWGHIPTHGAVGPGHMAFRIFERDIEHWRQHLIQHGVAIESEIEWPEGGHSLYFRDPSGNSLELATPRLWGFEERE